MIDGNRTVEYISNLTLIILANTLENLECLEVATNNTIPIKYNNISLNKIVSYTKTKIRIHMNPKGVIYI